MMASLNVHQGAKDPADKAKSVCETLRSGLPSYDAIMQALAENGAWWSSFRVKIRALSGASPFEGIEAFAARAYTSKNPAELGTLAVALARSESQYDHLYAVVENLIIADLKFSATGEGMECLVLLAKAHTDIGQPRKSWMLWRRAMTIAQLMVRVH
jgi:hypothetical protein